MAVQKTEDEGSGSRPRRFQYSVRAMFGLTTAVAIACAIFFAMPAWVGGLTTACVVISMPGVLAIVVVYGRGNTRAFGIGALFPASLCLLTCSSSDGLKLLQQVVIDLLDFPESGIAFLIFLNIYFAIVLGNGFLAVGMRRWLESGQRLVVPPSPAGDQEPQAAEADADPNRPRNEEP
jgi:hypothetical protein